MGEQEPSTDGATWRTQGGGTLTPQEMWALERRHAPAVVEVVGRCAYCQHILVHMRWRRRQLPYRLWVWRGTVMQLVGAWRARRMGACPQCRFNDEVRGR